MGERRRPRPVGQRTLAADPPTDTPAPAEVAPPEPTGPPAPRRPPPEELPGGSNAALEERQRRWLRVREALDRSAAASDGGPSGGG